MGNFIKATGNLVYTALQLIPECACESDHSLSWTFERRDGFDIRWWADSRKWSVSWLVDGVDVSMDIHALNVLAVTIGPRLDSSNDHSSRDQSGKGAA